MERVDHKATRLSQYGVNDDDMTTILPTDGNIIKKLKIQGVECAKKQFKLEREIHEIEKEQRYLAFELRRLKSFKYHKDVTQRTEKGDIFRDQVVDSDNDSSCNELDTSDTESDLNLI